MSLSCMQKPEGQDQSVLVFSGFIVEIDDEWIYMTAGHILERVKEATLHGTKFDVWRLGDETARGQYQGLAIPFDFNPAEWLVVSDEDSGLDYAAVVLRPIYRAALEAGGAQPVPPQAWTSHLSEHDFWALLGVPSETVSHDGETIISARTVTLVLAPTESPVGPSEKDRYRFYAKLVGDSVDAVDNIEGMSGGPIFSLRAIDNNWHYSVIGVQSGWFPSSRVLIACPFALFVALVTEAARLKGE